MENFIPEAYSWYTIQDDEGNYLTCDQDGNLSLTPVPDLTGNTQNWSPLSSAAQTIIVNQMAGSFYLSSDGTNNDELTVLGNTTWSINDDGSFISIDFNPLYAASNQATKKPVGKVAKQTWTWSKKLTKSDGWEHR